MAEKTPMKPVMIIYGERKNDLQKKAIEILSEYILDYTFEYTPCYPYGAFTKTEDYYTIYIGTKQNNPYIKENSTAVLTKTEEYYIKAGKDVVIIEGYDDLGVLYGCVDYYNRYLVEQDFMIGNTLGRAGDVMGDFELQSAPAIKNRGLWTWGHVIYDYKGYIDNMLKLKMNTLIMWNEFVPLNAKEIYEYAHSAGVKLIWGFTWLYNFNKPMDLSSIYDKVDGIIEEFERDYKEISGDGIYFQTFTEYNEENANGVDIARTATDFVNHVASRFYEKYPNLEIQFGLHATSCKNKLDILKDVDPRIQIVWEDCGAFPFAYSPMQVSNFDETFAFAEKIATLREDKENFGVVLKGATCLDWSAFKHHDGPFNIGVSSKRMKANRVERKSRAWRWAQTFWVVNGKCAQKMIKMLADKTGGNMWMTDLVEDGMFEEKIYLPVAIFSELMWEPDIDFEKLYKLITLRPNVEYV